MKQLMGKMNAFFCVSLMLSMVMGPLQVSAEALTSTAGDQIATITEPADGDTLAGMIEIRARAPAAENLEFLILNDVSQRTTVRARALKQGSENWIFYWDTGKSQDGGYVLSAQATSPTGSSYSAGSVHVTVQNHDDTSEVTTPVADPRTLVITSPLSGSTLSSSSLITVTGQANGVYIFALAQDDQELNYIGEASESSTDAWSISWNTTSLPDGTYELYAQSSILGGEEWLSERVPVAVQNGLLRDQDDPSLPVGLGSEYIILEQSTPVLEAVSDTGRVQSVLKTDAAAEILGNATITNLTLYKINTSTVPGTEVIEGMMVLQGVGPANAGVTIRVFSEPIVATTTTDSEGNWVYTIDSSLSKGRHEVYVTVGDTSEQVVGRSPLFEFLVSEAVAASDQVTDSVTTVVSSNRNLLEKYSLAVGGVIIAVLALFVVLQRMARKNHS